MFHDDPNDREGNCMPVISVREVTHIYRSGWGRTKIIRALDDISIDVPEGELVGVIGTNGAGKTTFVKCLLGVVYPEQGEISVLGRSPDDPRGKTDVGFLPEAYPHDRFLTGRAFLEFHAGMSGLRGTELRRRIRELAGELDLARDLDRSIKHYSKGMCRRLGLIQALMHCPKLLILDEPADGLDPLGRTALRSFLGRLRDAGTTILLNSHILSEVEMICDRVVILHHGRIIRSGRVRDLVGDRGITAIRIDAADRPGISVLPEEVVVDDAGDTCDIIVNTPDEVHSVLDHLRREGIHILEVQPRTSTLEEVFLKIVGDAAGKEMRA
jgi:ABC-2 type transport system ATP-binding protein